MVAVCSDPRAGDFDLRRPKYARAALALKCIFLAPRPLGDCREKMDVSSLIGQGVMELAYRFDQSPGPYTFCVPESLPSHYRPCIFKRQAHTKTQPRQQSPCSCPRLRALVVLKIPGSARRDMMEDVGPVLQGRYGAGLAGLGDQKLNPRNVGISLQVFALKPVEIWRVLSKFIRPQITSSHAL